jgi:hypothetical protein
MQRALPERVERFVFLRALRLPIVADNIVPGPASVACENGEDFIG